MNGPFFTVLYAIYIYLLFTLVSNLFDGAGSSLILPLTLIIAGIYLLATVVQGLHPNQITHFLAVISEIWKGTSIYLLILTIIMHIISWIVNIPDIFFGIVLLVSVTLIAIYAVYNADKITIKNIDLSFDNLNEDFKFIHISDLHIGAIRRDRLLNNIVNKINEPNQVNADFVVITGDLADGSSPIYPNSFEILAKSKIPIFFTPGNHDFYPGIDNVIKAAKNANIRILSNQTIEIKNTQLIGIPFGRNGFTNSVSKNVDSDSSKTSKKFADFSHSVGSVGSNDFNNFDHEHIDIGNQIPNVESNENNSIDVNLESNRNSKDFEINIDLKKTSILLHHVPVGWDLFKDIGIDLVLSGHTHGGQFFPFNYFVKRVFPYLRGLYEDNGKYMYVSDGIGTLTPPMRLGTSAEMAVFHLKKKK